MSFAAPKPAPGIALACWRADAQVYSFASLSAMVAAASSMSSARSDLKGLGIPSSDRSALFAA